LIKRKSGLRGYACRFSRWEFLVARISKDELEYCRKQNACYDCHSDDTIKTAVELQTRRRLKVPCCRKHFNAYKTKINEAGAKKYARSAAIKRKAGECTYKGCHHKLIPQEFLPPKWKRESTCGMHGVFKAFRVNRAGLVRFLIQHCLSPGLGEGMAAQHIIYHAGEGHILFGLSKPNVYLTRGFSASDLVKRYKAIQAISRKKIPLRSNEISCAPNS
jgi:hypothetical protein